MNNEKIKQKLKILENLVEEDCCNGRFIQKKLKNRLIKNGSCTKTIIQELKIIKKTQ